VSAYWLANARAWRDIANLSQNPRAVHHELKRELAPGTPVGEIFWQQVDRRAAMFRALPQDVAKYLVRHITAETLQGRTTEEVMQDVQELFPHFSHTRAKLIARTEAAKTYADIVEARSQAMGYHWYVWQTAHDERVRTSHRHMQSVIVRFDDPPNPEELAGMSRGSHHYGPGGTWNCRCYAAPLVSLNQVDRWPAKVYMNDRLIPMRQREFRRLWEQDAPGVIQRVGAHAMAFI
jgi:SPP1 gp7 family putative phage head morphogenesis protein